MAIRDVFRRGIGVLALSGGVVMAQESVPGGWGQGFGHGEFTTLEGNPMAVSSPRFGGGHNGLPIAPMAGSMPFQAGRVLPGLPLGPMTSNQAGALSQVIRRSTRARRGR